MAKMQIKRLGVFSVAKVYAMVMAGIALVIVIPVGLISMVLGAALSSRGSLAGGLFGGVFMIILAPVIYGVIGFIFGAIGALIYNIAAGFVGGVELELDAAATEYGAPPPPQWNQYQQPGGGYQSGQQPPY